MASKHIVHLELTSNRTSVSLPFRLNGVETKASILWYDFQPITFAQNLNGDVTGPYYFQLRFTGGGLDSSYFISNAAAPGMIQLPLIRFNGWPANFPMVHMPLWSGKRMESKFLVEVFDEGDSPAPFTFGADTRLNMWLSLDLTPDSYSSLNSSVSF
jgi:hypothetical protein